MKKRIVVLLALIILMLPMTVNAEEPELKKMSLTCYIMNNNLTYSGTECRNGICAVDKEHIGMIAIVYLVNDDDSIGQCIGMYSCEDLIGTEAGRKGYVIDLYRVNMTQAVNTMKITGGKCYVEYIDGKG